MYHSVAAMGQGAESASSRLSFWTPMESNPVLLPVVFAMADYANNFAKIDTCQILNWRIANLGRLGVAGAVGK
jgi:hypothetical protein